MTRMMAVLVFLLSSFISSLAQAASVEDWLARLQSELPAAVEQRFKSRPNIQCRATTSKEGRITIDEIAVKQENMCYVRSQDNSTEKQVMVFTPTYCFRLHSDASGSGFTINRITESKNSPDYQTTTRFPFQLTIDDTLFAHSYIKDVRVDELLRLGTVRHLETLTDKNLGELAKFEVDLTADEGNFQTVSMTLIPSHQWALKQWTVKFKEIRGGNSTETREIEYSTESVGGFPTIIRTLSKGRPPGGEEFQIESSLQISNIEMNAVDDAVFTLPYYGLPDLFEPKHPASGMLNPWIWGSLVAAVAIAWWLYKSRDHKKTA